MIFNRVRDNVHTTFSIYIIPILDCMVILPSSLCLPPWEGFWVFFSGNPINPWPGASFPPAEKENRLSARRQLSRPRRAVTLLLKKGWLKLFLFGVNFPKIILFEIIFSSLMFQTRLIAQVRAFNAVWCSSRGWKASSCENDRTSRNNHVHHTCLFKGEIITGFIKLPMMAFLPQHSRSFIAN